MLKKVVNLESISEETPPLYSVLIQTSNLRIRKDWICVSFQWLEFIV